MSTGEIKRWDISKGVLGYDSTGSLAIPSANEIYSAIFENIYSVNITADDVRSMKDKITFSRYPLDLKIVLQASENGDSIELGIRALTDDKFISISWKNKQEHIVIENIWYPFIPENIEEITDIFKSCNIAGPGKITLGQYLLLLKVPKELVENMVDATKLNLSDKYPDEAPRKIKAQLYPYQKKGWQWLRFMKQEKIGGILADEMGLGKTLQIISLISSDPSEEFFPSLIISPTTLLENWRREFQKFAPHISTNVHQGPKRTGFPNELRNCNVIITSYDTVIRDNSLFGQIEWKVVICDEAQAIKNPQTRRAISVKSVPRQIGLAVTGTPIENRLMDLWSIMDFSVPGFLGEQSAFENAYENSADGPRRLETMISPLILRRRVAEVAKDLPAKIVIPQVLDLSDAEVGEYERIREETIAEFGAVASLVVLTRLRLFCTHPFLLSDNPHGNPSDYSNKYVRLIEIVEEVVENGAKVLVFTSFNKMNDIIVTDLRKRFGIYSASIDGRTATEDRQKIVDEFSAFSGPALLVLNPIAAGTGLNITAANHVIHYNLEWNPAKEDQASARAYRRGQDRPVTIHRLYYGNTVEEAINERLDRKRTLAGTAIVGVQGDEQDYDDILNAINKSPKHKQ